LSLGNSHFSKWQFLNMKLGIFYCCATVIAAEIYSVIKNLCKLSCIYVLMDLVGFELLARWLVPKLV
jgi:hypothetical protein